MSKNKIKKSILQAIQQEPINKEIKKISLFGSYLHGVPKKSSDIDLIIEFQPSANVGFFELSRIKRVLKKAVGKEIDLLTPPAISRYLKEEIVKKAETIYER